METEPAQAIQTGQSPESKKSKEALDFEIFSEDIKGIMEAVESQNVSIGKLGEHNELEKAEEELRLMKTA